MATTRPFAISTFLFQQQRLAREHLLDVASQGFTSVELFAARGHLDYQNPAAVADLQQWLGDAGLAADTVYVPPTEDAGAALLLGRRIAFRSLVVQVPAAPREASRLVERLVEAAAPLGVGIAIDSTSMSPIGSVAHFVEEGIEGGRIEAALDFGHAQVAGDLVDAIETLSGHLATTHVHDARGRRDDHLVPFDGAIDWPSVMTAVQKIGFDGPLVFDVAAHGATRDTLAKLRRARERLQKLLEL